MKLKVVLLSCSNQLFVDSSYCCYLLTEGARNLLEFSPQDEAHHSSLRKRS